MYIIWSPSCRDLDQQINPFGASTRGKWNCKFVSGFTSHPPIIINIMYTLTLNISFWASKMAYDLFSLANVFALRNVVVGFSRFKYLSWLGRQNDDFGVKKGKVDLKSLVSTNEMLGSSGTEICERNSRDFTLKNWGVSWWSRVGCVKDINYAVETKVLRLKTGK